MTEPAENLEAEGEEEGEFGDGEDGDEYVLLEGETFFYGGKSEFCQKTGALVLAKDEGAVLVGMMGQGLVSLHDFLKKQGKPVMSAVK